MNVLPAATTQPEELSAGEQCKSVRCISVIIPVRNAATTIARTLRSLIPDAGLISQILVMDDGSTDGSASVAAEMARLSGLPLQVIPVCAGSAGGARNAGIERATGEFIFMLDADDELLAGGLAQLLDALCRNPHAGLSIGANIRRTAGRPDKLKIPSGYGNDPTGNATTYLRNGMWPIAMGSALIVSAQCGSIRFPEAIGLDEDTCFWAALLSLIPVATVTTPVLLYHHDEERMAQRFRHSPRKTLLAISREFEKLADFGIDRDTLQWRKAWIALRIVRQLLMGHRYDDAAQILRTARAHAAFRNGWKVFQYRLRIVVGKTLCTSPAPTAATVYRTGQRRTLVLTYDPAWPPISGADLRNWANARAAAQSGPVALVSVRPTEATPPSPETGVTIVALQVAGDCRTASVAQRRASIEPRIPVMALQRLLELVQTFRPEVIVIEGIPLFRLIQPLRALTHLLILDMHNVESILAKQQNEQATTTLRLKRFFQNDAGRIRRLERKAAALVDRVWVCSEADRDRLLTSASPKSVHIIPNGIPHIDDTPKTLPPLAPRTAGWPEVLFVGHLGYWPNVDAALRLAHFILPLIRQQFPNARLTLAGRYPKPAVKALADIPGVQLFENPHDLSDFYHRAHLSIAPIRAGGGTRIKILEAMAWGLAVVATPLAVEGLDLADGIDVTLADTDGDLARLACELCGDPARLEQQRALAHAMVRLQFGPQAIERAVRFGLKPGELEHL